jgi:hypothetical protein
MIEVMMHHPNRRRAHALLWSVVLLTVGMRPVIADAQSLPGEGPILRAATALTAQHLRLTGISTTQRPADDREWSHARQLLTPGLDVRVRLDEESSVRGTFRVADDESITITVHGIDRRVARSQLRAVAMAIGTQQRKHMNIGMAIGAVAAGLAILRHCDGQDNLCYENAMLFYMPLMGAGAAAGHFWPRGTAWREVYVRGG